MRGPVVVAVVAGPGYSANDCHAAGHGGTHLDAPIHFARNGDTAEEIPLRKVVGPAVTVDVRARATADRDHLISVVVALPMRIQGGSGGPLRATAIVGR